MILSLIPVFKKNTVGHWGEGIYVSISIMWYTLQKKNLPRLKKKITKTWAKINGCFGTYYTSKYLVLLYILIV